jgi:hypothetical protein
LTTYNAILDNTLTGGVKPQTESLDRALRDNPLAIAEGDASAPRIQIKAINSPYFLATRSSDFNVNVSNSTSKFQFNNEVYDPDGVYDSATNHRFTPNRPGVYLVSVQIYVATATTSQLTNSQLSLRKNGSGSGNILITTPVTKSDFANGLYSMGTLTVPVQMNGTTDYLEVYYFDSGTVDSNTGWRGNFSAVGLCEI